ncbi:histone acetyltransferase [Malassezia vespertilionis]|uniref:Histone acetyltransferase type B catalytic subunit n=1 Tax=Malassezia vespertilionis TaxID=2020962 RepID=A0A2N1JDP6_9BASI|nr:histone acetyltransferase [Malassezia vespertilionis]PKI84677.1 Hat1p [Malassezia vespertilionis]WFD06058.1 histone acetyltransferase [Malassezia vespertilionis]
MPAWTSNANEATRLRLVGAPAPQDAVFYPEFTYPIFGEAETIFGYEGLHINLDFCSGSLMPSLGVSYSAKNSKTSAKIDDPEETLRAFLPDTLARHDTLVSLAEKEAQGGAFSPHGTNIAEYSVKGKERASRGVFGARARTSDAARNFVVHHATWDTPGFRAWHERAQIFTLFYIEGASYIDDQDPNWEFYTIFERTRGENADAYHFVGYTSTYRFWSWQDKTRLRISQFLILPPYQKQGHGTQLYDTVFARALDDARVCEVTVEDPSESFDLLRDKCDLRRIANAPMITTARKDNQLHAPLAHTWSEEARAQAKMAPRQWSRILEMLLLVHLDADNEESMRAYRLQIKARIFRVNREALLQLPRAQRQAKLQETFEAVVDEYSEITGAPLPDMLLEAPPIVERDELHIPGLAKRAASAVILLGDGEEEEEEEEYAHKARRLG